MMANVVAWLGAKGILLVSGAGLALALGLAIKLVPNLLAKILGKKLDDLLSANDPADKELLLALVKWANSKIPGPGKGKEKFDLVASKLVTWFPALKSQEGKIEELIETSVLRMKAEMESRLVP